MADKDKENNKEPTCKLTMFPACEGDCFLLEFGTGEDTFRMMIDSGTVGFGNKRLKEYLNDNQFKKDEKMIDLLLITHFDGDHIGGALSLLRTKKYGELIKEVWHNGLFQISPDLFGSRYDYGKWWPKGRNGSIHMTSAAGTGVNYPKKFSIHMGGALGQQSEKLSIQMEGASAEQSQCLSKLLKEQQEAQEKIINGISDGKAITADLGRTVIEFGSGIEIYVLLPEKKHLPPLLEYFKTKLPTGMKISAAAAYQECVDEEQDNGCEEESCAADNLDITQMEKWVEQIEKDGWDRDNSKKNAASIAIIICYNEKKYLFAGDAWGNELSEALKNWGEVYNQSLYFDVVKLPHHGSNRNCLDLLSTDGLDGKIFLVSTNGGKHPGKETLAKIVIRPAKETRILAFNYEHAMYTLFNNKECQDRYNYRVLLTKESNGFEVIER